MGRIEPTLQVAIKRLPEECDCGHQSSVEHAQSCPMGGIPSQRHNKIRDWTASLSSQVCNNVTIELYLQPLMGEKLSGASANLQDGVRLDVAANGLWGSDMSELTQTLESSTPSHLPTDTAPLPCAIKNTKTKKDEYINRG